MIPYDDMTTKGLTPPCASSPPRPGGSPPPQAPDPGTSCSRRGRNRGRRPISTLYNARSSWPARDPYGSAGPRRRPPGPRTGERFVLFGHGHHCQSHPETLSHRFKLFGDRPRKQYGVMMEIERYFVFSAGCQRSPYFAGGITVGHKHVIAD